MVLWYLRGYMNRKDEAVLLIQNFKAENIQQQTIVNLEKNLSSSDLKVKIDISTQSLKEHLADTSFTGAGIFTTGNITRADLYGKIVTPLLTISPDKHSECFNESAISVLKNSRYQKLEHLKGKNVAITRKGLRPIALNFADFKAKNMNFASFTLAQSPAEAIKDLKAKKIDAIIWTKTVFDDDNTVSAEDMLGDNFEMEDKALKVLNITNAQLPCSLFIVNNKLPPEIRKKLIESFKNNVSNPQLAADFKNLGNIGSYRELSVDKIKDIRSVIDVSIRFQLDEFSKNSIQE